MRIENTFRVSIGIALIALTFGGSSTTAFAQSAVVSCFLAPAKASDGDITSFLSQPNTLLSDFPSAGLALSSKVRGLTGSSSDVLAPMIALVKDANAPQKSAIGAGLARAAKSCQVTNPDFALQVQQKVAAANDPDLTTAFAAGMDDVQTAALGAASTGASAASGISSVGTPGAPSGKIGTDTAVKTVATTFNDRTNSSFTVGTGATFTVASTQQAGTSPSN